MSLLDAARWIIGAALVLFGGYVVGFNWATIPWNSRLHAQGVERHVSSMPIIGPLALTLGAACMLWGASAHLLWFWLIDWPTASLPIALLWHWRRSRAAAPERTREPHSD